jgi:hypothetical protein
MPVFSTRLPSSRFPGREPMRSRKTESINDVTERVMQRADPTGKRHGSRAVSAWNRAAGPEIAKHTLGAALRDGNLIVYVDSAAWANELALMSDRFLAAIRSETGQDLVRSMRFTVSKKVAEQRSDDQQEAVIAEHYQTPTNTTKPLSDSERRQAAHIAAAIQDESLRETALRVMIKDLEWKKGDRASKSAETRADGPEGHNSSL